MCIMLCHGYEYCYLSLKKKLKILSAYLNLILPPKTRSYNKYLTISIQYNTILL